jgi:outer membrane protein insertion porin family
MVLGNIEITHPIYDFIRGAVFVDAGNAWWSGGQFGDLNVGAGYGLRVKLPYLNAPMKFDLAYPIVVNQDHIDRKLRFHFNVGFTW